jgi:hypothetical protein
MERDYRYPWPSGDSISTIAANINASRPQPICEEYTPMPRPSKKLSLKEFIFLYIKLPFKWATRHDFAYDFSRTGKNWYTIHSCYWWPNTLKKAISKAKADPYNGIAAGCQFRNIRRIKKENLSK